MNDFNIGVELKLYYTDEEISGIEEATLKIYHLNELTSTWDLVGGDVDTEANCVSATVSHFSVYCLMGEDTTETVSIENAISYPNPMSNGAVFSFELTKTAEVTVEVYTLSGRMVKRFETETRSAGYVEIPEGEMWDGMDDDNDELGSGVYYWKITADDEGEVATETGKLVVVK